MNMRRNSRERSVDAFASPGWYTIKQMADTFGLTHRALRFYEQRGLLRPVRNGPRTQRLYTHQDHEILKKILRGKRLGFTIAEIQEMMCAGKDIGETGEFGLALEPQQILKQIRFMERQQSEIADALRVLREAYGRTTGAAAKRPIGTRNRSRID